MLVAFDGLAVRRGGHGPGPVRQAGGAHRPVQLVS